MKNKVPSSLRGYPKANLKQPEPALRQPKPTFLKSHSNKLKDALKVKGGMQ